MKAGAAGRIPDTLMARKAGLCADTAPGHITGAGPDPPSHGWFIGYRGDLAFAVLVEGGGTGADSAGPIANAFLREP
jgi:cell division protein FtsI/penicillin-binding protein 2